MATIVDHGLLSIVPIALLPILPEGKGLYFHWFGVAINYKILKVLIILELVCWFVCCYNTP